MTTYIALLRAVNVGGTGKLAMSDLRAICADLGYLRVGTYIASGNVVFDCTSGADRVKAGMEKKLLDHTGRVVSVFVRTAEEMRNVFERNPFSKKESKLTYAFFLQEKPASDALEDVRGQAQEEICLGTREIYVHYPVGMGESKLVIPATRVGTARNLNTVARLVEMSSRD